MQTTRELRDALAASQHSSEVWCSKYDKLEKEFVKLQKFAAKLEASSKNLKQAVNALGIVISYL